MTQTVTVALTDAVTWRARALRYTLIFVLLGSALVGLRYQTHGVRPQLKALQTERKLLADQKAALELKVQGVTSPGRVREWALGQGMQPFSQTAKDGASFAGTPEPAALPRRAPARIEVHTAWK